MFTKVRVVAGATCRLALGRPGGKATSVGGYFLRRLASADFL